MFYRSAFAAPCAPLSLRLAYFLVPAGTYGEQAARPWLTSEGFGRCGKLRSPRAGPTAVIRALRYAATVNCSPWCPSENSVEGRGGHGQFWMPFWSI